MGMKEKLKKALLSIWQSDRVVVLDYPALPQPSYPAPKPHAGLQQRITANDALYREQLEKALQYREAVLSIQQQKDIQNETDPGWNNGFFPGLDIIMLYALLARYQPATYLEIGSGTSTRVAAKAKKEQGLATKIICVDPQPRRSIGQVADEVHTQGLQAFPLTHFSRLQSGDIVFFDGTHLLYPGSDVMWFFLEVLPLLPSGVIVQIHDIYLPFDYPNDMCRRFYNEQYMLAATLLNTGRYEIIAPNFYISSTPALHTVLEPYWSSAAMAGVERHGGSFWMRVR